MKKLLLFGGSGKLGAEILAQRAGLDIIAPSHGECDITDLQSVQKTITKHKPEGVINAAALVGMRECENDKDMAWRINVVGATNIAKVCNRLGVKLTFVSSAAIFDGSKGDYRETDTPTPVYYYAVTKVAAEQAVSMIDDHIIVRVDMFPLTGFKYRDVLSDHYTSKIPMNQAAEKILKIVSSKFVGVINIGQPRDSVYNIMKPYYPEIRPIRLVDSPMPNFPKDISLNLTKWQENFGEIESK